MSVLNFSETGVGAPIIIRPSVWENLPVDLLMKILTHLPLASCLGFRAVCKQWKAMIDSPQFLGLCMERPWFLVFQRLKNDAVHIFDPEDKKWFRCPLTFLPAPVCVRAAAGNLLCAEERDAENFFKSLYVCDPLAKKWLKLPSMKEETYWKPRSITLVVDELGGCSFRVFVACNYQLQMYDSTTGSWRRIGQAPVGLISVVLCKPTSTLYSLSPTLGYELVPTPHQLLSFNLEERVWRLVDIRMPMCLTSPHLTEKEDGRIVMVGGVWRKNMVRSLRIWELNLEQNSWDLVVKVPRHFWKQLTAGNWNSACAWSGELICIASNNRMLAYNLNNKEWVLSPPSLADPFHGDLMSVSRFKHKSRF